MRNGWDMKEIVGLVHTLRETSEGIKDTCTSSDKVQGLESLASNMNSNKPEEMELYLNKL